MPDHIDNLTAVLGPTNTGKTHYAMERMAGYDSGMIGFPLRLLARENYDKYVERFSPRDVALITGEEKIIPRSAKYFFCTVEAMPVNKPVDFIAIDEVQLAADPERGHIFTDRILNLRGDQETVFLGADTMIPILKRLFDGIEIIERERFSSLTYAGYKKIGKLPKRSAVVAFSIMRIYDMADQIRQRQGGTAIVLGALSPKTRNAQIDLYQNGDVDYLVATDAIGMGLNMDIDHVAFAGTGKYDGRRFRHLAADEMAQIAGRAGRYKNPGTFGATAEVDELPSSHVVRIEEHNFAAIEELFWRNPDLEFDSLSRLIDSLSISPEADHFRRGREADDVLTLKALSSDVEIQKIAENKQRLPLLWEVCQIPDFRQVLPEAHARFAKEVFIKLIGLNQLPADWMDDRLSKLDNPAGSIDTLMTRLSYIRTWCYIANRSDWVKDPAHWRARTKEIEETLSDALHDRLTKRFVDRRQIGLIRNLSADEPAQAGIQNDGSVVIEGEKIGRLHGFQLTLDDDIDPEQVKMIKRLARRTLSDEISHRLKQIKNGSAKLHLMPDGQIIARLVDPTKNPLEKDIEFPVARLKKGSDLYHPQIDIADSDLLPDSDRDDLADHLRSWVTDQIGEYLSALTSDNEQDFSPQLRQIFYQLEQGMGICHRRSVNDVMKKLESDDRRTLKRLGVWLGSHYLYFQQLIALAPMRWRFVLYGLDQGIDLSAQAFPHDGDMSLKLPDHANSDLYAAISMPDLGGRAVRVDMVERFISHIFDKKTNGTVQLDPADAALIGCPLDDLPGVMDALGCQRKDDMIYTLPRWRTKTHQKKKAKQRKKQTPKPDSPFADLKDLLDD